MGFPKMWLPKFSSEGWGPFSKGPKKVAAMWDAENDWDHITYSTYINNSHIYIDVIQPRKSLKWSGKKWGRFVFYFVGCF